MALLDYLQRASLARTLPVALALSFGQRAHASAPGPAPSSTEAESEDDGEEAEVVVSGSRPHPAAAPRAPYVAGSLLRGERLEQPGGSAAELLREAPGLQVTQTGGMGSPATASLRGATAAQTPVYLAGVRINDEVGGAANLADVPLFLIDRAEVYRSHAPADVELGLGGAILFEPKRLRRAELGFGAQGGAYGARGAHTYGSFGGGARWLLAGVELSAADNDYEFYDDRGTLFDDEDGGVTRLRNADARQTSLWLLGGTNTDGVETEIVLHHSDREQGAPKLALVPSESARVQSSRELFALSSRIPVDAWHGQLHLSTTAASSATAIDDPQNELNLLRSYVETAGERLEQRVQAKQTYASGLTLSQEVTVATERLRRSAREGGSMVQQASARRFGVRPALAAQLPLGRGFSLSGTVAGRCYDTSTGALTVCSTLAPEGRAGVAFEASFATVYANLGHYNRLPTLGELHGASQLVRGNHALVAEQGDSVELGARFARGKRGGAHTFWVDLSAFGRRSRELITYVRSAQGYLSPVNRDSSLTLGGEVALGASPLRGLEGSLVISVVDARDTSPDRTTKNDVLPFVSRATGSALVSYTQPFEGFVNEASLGLRALYQSSRYADPAGLGVIPAQTSVDLETSLRLVERRITARGRVANLFDAERFDVVGFPLPGRSGFFSVEATW